jgi:hypothetical protein
MALKTALEAAELWSFGEGIFEILEMAVGRCYKCPATVIGLFGGAKASLRKFVSYKECIM